MTDPMMQSSSRAPMSQPSKFQTTANAMQSTPVPFLSQNHQTLAFGRLDSDYFTHSRVLQPDALLSLSHTTKQVLDSIVTVELNITLEEFTYVVQTMLLKRVQDVYRRIYAVNPPDKIMLPRIARIPAPIFDVLNSIGTFHSKVTGVNYVSVPPAKARRDPPPYWDLNLAVFQRFNIEMSRLQHLYTMREFPSHLDTEDRPLLITELSNYNEDDEIVFVKAWTNEPRPSDALIRSVCEEIYADDNLITYDNCKLMMSQEIVKQSTLAEYAGSYVMQSNS